MRKEIIFVADFFADEILGGAELTSEALINAASMTVHKVKAIEVTRDFILSNKDSFWVFGNFTQFKYLYLKDVIENLNYAVIEYDYKFCIYRSIELHRAMESADCDCHRYFGKEIANFYKNAAVVFWMSAQQRDLYLERFITLTEANNIILSSVFDPKDIQKIKDIREQSNERSGWLIVDSSSWIKGVEDSVSYCEKNGLTKRIVSNLKYDQLLQELGRCEGVVMMPKGGDSCPRLAIEAKLAGCKLISNDNIQQKGEEWFEGSVAEMERYLLNRPSLFWGTIERLMMEAVNDQKLFI